MRLTSKDIAAVEGVRRTAMPKEIEPMKATLIDEPFSREGWIFENKYDGVRSVCYVRGGKVRLVSRNQKDMTIKYPELAELPKWIDADEAVLDGEIVVLNVKGQADFQELQGRFGLTNLKEIAKLRASQNIVLYAFDLLYVDGYDLMRAPLLERKRLLKKIVRKRKNFQFAEHVKTEGEKLFKKAERAHSEGIIAKNACSLYEQRRSNEWLKIKTVQRQEAVICGYTEPKGSREYFGALHLGLYQGRKLISVGKVGAGFDHDKLKKIYTLMQPLRIDHHPFDNIPKEKTRWSGPDVVRWLKPKLVCEVRFSERTGDGSFRHPVFEGLRFDKKPTECTYEQKHSAQSEITGAERKAAPAKRAQSPTKGKASAKSKLTVSARGKRTMSTATKRKGTGSAAPRAKKAVASKRRSRSSK